MNRTWRTSRLAIGLIAVLAVSACGGTGESAPGVIPAADKAGADTAPLTLRLGTEDDEGRPGAQQIKHFAERVSSLSAGRIVIEPVWDAGGPQDMPEWDQVVARMVVAGELDMAITPSRAWDTEGVLTMRALQAPFLVTSDALAAGIATSDLAPEMLAGLTDVGVTGLALVPEGIRYLFAFGAPPMTIDDFKGLHVRAPLSKTNFDVLEALGTIPDDFTDPGESIEATIGAGGAVAGEASFAVAGMLPAATTAIGNLPLFPKVNSLVVNTAVLDRLTDEQRRVLHDAAAEMVAWSIETMPGTAADAETFCRNGGAVVVMDEHEVKALREAVQPMMAVMREDAATKSMIDHIGALAQGITAEVTEVAPCGPPTAEKPSPGPSGPAEAVEFPEGVYRKTVTTEFLMSQGIDRSTADGHAETWTLTFRDGQFLDPDCPNSTYEVAGGRIIVTMGPEGPSCGTAAGKVLFDAPWTLEGDQLLFTDVQAGDGRVNPLGSALFGSQPYTKLR